MGKELLRDVHVGVRSSVALFFPRFLPGSWRGCAEILTEWYNHSVAWRGKGFFLSHLLILWASWAEQIKLNSPQVHVMVGWINPHSLAAGPQCVQWIWNFSVRERETASEETAAALCLALPDHSCCKIVASIIHYVKPKPRCLHNNSELAVVVWGRTFCS